MVKQLSRPIIPLLTLTLAVFGASLRSTASETSYADHAHLHPVEAKDVRWADGFWGHRHKQCANVIVPNLWRVMQIPDNAATFQDLRMAAGLTKRGTPGGTKWSDGDCHKCIEAMAHLYEQNNDPQLATWMDEAISTIAKAQEPDGYLSSWVQLKGVDRWANLNNHELYNMGHLLTAACVHHRATGKDNYLKIAIRTGDYLHKTFMTRPKELAHFGFNPSNIMGAIDLYRTTGNPKYLQLAKVFVDMRGSQRGGSNQNQASVPLRKETEAVGHCVTATYLWCGAADVYAELGDQRLLEALHRLWKDVTAHKMYITGGTAALHFGEVTRTTFQRWPRDSVHEAFGASYQLPNRTAYNETCANIGNAMWNWRMLNLTGEARFADLMERVLYNSMLSAISLDGKCFFYTNPLRRAPSNVPLLNHDSPIRWPDTTPSSPVHCFCCPPSVARTIAKLHRWAYSLSDDSVWVHLYGSNNLKTSLPGGSDFALTQKTDYPWDGEITITVDEAPARQTVLQLRIPDWATDPTVAINGQPQPDELTPGSYAALRRTWKTGDVIKLTLPMETVFMQAHPLVEEARNHVAVMRGPIVYCLESADLPKGIDVDRVLIQAENDWTPHWEKQLLSGVTTLEGELLVSDPQAWENTLYRRMAHLPNKRIKARLIPYYAWANRGVSQMAVWIPIH